MVTLDWSGPYLGNVILDLVKSNVRNVTRNPHYWSLTYQGWYVFYTGSTCLSVGKTGRKGNALRTRLREHFLIQTAFGRYWKQTAIPADMLRIYVVACTPELEDKINNEDFMEEKKDVLQVVEGLLIAKLHPKYFSDKGKNIDNGNLP